MTQDIEVKNILPDEDQPRKFFAADKMFTLRKSIEKHGIRVPLVVEEMGNGKYLLIDGERRFRSALELGLKVVPCVVEAPKDPTQRLIEQFNIQEQHEQWTPIEKAMSIINLSKALSLDLRETCKKLDVGTRETARYIAFAELADKESYIKNEVPLDYVTALKSLKGMVKNVSMNELKTEFTRNDEKTLEHQVTKLIVKGVMVKRNDLSKLKDALKKEPKLIDKFMHDDKVTPISLFLEAKAQGAYSLRNVFYSCRSVSTHGKAFLKVHDVKISPEQLVMFKDSVSVLQKLIDTVE